MPHQSTRKLFDLNNGLNWSPLCQKYTFTGKILSIDIANTTYLN
jgi:hypothetical protein